MNSLQESGQQTALQDAVAEYKRLLAYQDLDDLRDIARRWNVKLHSGSKASIIDQLATRFSEPHVQEAILAELDDVGSQVLAYVHLLLAPEYGLSADSIVRGMLHQRQRASQPARAGESFLEPYREQWAQDIGTKRKIQEQITMLAQRGLLLPFKQNSALYYTLPNLVRICLSPQPDLVPAYAGDAQVLDVHETMFGALIHKLFSVWNTISRGIPGKDGSLIRQGASPRQPIENQWSLLRGWDHDPSEVSVLMRNQYSDGRASPLRLDRVSAATLNWAMTVPAPLPRLQDPDRQYIRRQVGGTDGQIEFYCALLESLGALSGPPGQPIAAHKDGLQRFLRLSAPAKVHALWHAWTHNETWSEMQVVLRQDGLSALRLRRSLAHHDYKAEDLHQEWRVGRGIVLRFLSLLPENQWLSIDGFFRTVFDVYPNLLHTFSDPSVWWLESPRTGRQFGTAFEDWQQSYGQFVLSMLQGPLQWLGIVRLGYAAGGTAVPDTTAAPVAAKPVAFQVTETGSYAMGRRTELVHAHISSSVPDESSCSVSEDLTVAVVPDRAPLELHDLLHRTGRLLEATPDRFVYQLTAEGVSDWLQSGSAMQAEILPQSGASAESEASVEALIALLGKYCPASATTWHEKLRTWERNRGLLHIYENITLVELSDDYALQELLISTSLADSLVYQFSPRLVAIRADGVDALVEEMEQRGYTPCVK